jgi:hypothetical protein
MPALAQNIEHRSLEFGFWSFVAQTFRIFAVKPCLRKSHKWLKTIRL